MPPVLPSTRSSFIRFSILIIPIPFFFSFPQTPFEKTKNLLLLHHRNVSFALLLIGVISPTRFVLYMMSQFLGSIGTSKLQSKPPFVFQRNNPSSLVHFQNTHLLMILILLLLHICIYLSLSSGLCSPSGSPTRSSSRHTRSWSWYKPRPRIVYRMFHDLCLDPLSSLSSSRKTSCYVLSTGRYRNHSLCWSYVC